MANYPDPGALGFRHSDRSEHAAGGYCASKSKGRIRGWDDLLDQHLNALSLLVNAATEEGGGWGLTRPVLFEAHHVCELALKTAPHAAELRDARTPLVRTGRSRTAQ